jgi:hypothetical protein
LGTNLASVGGIAELAFLLWLIVMGARTRPAAQPTEKGALAWSA